MSGHFVDKYSVIEQLRKALLEDAQVYLSEEDSNSLDVELLNFIETLSSDTQHEIEEAIKRYCYTPAKVLCREEEEEAPF